MNKHTRQELIQMQSLPLEIKIKMTERRIQEWYEHWDGDVYVSFSGGKDSTVLLDIARRLYPDIEAVYSDTGLEYPEIREFVKTVDNVTWIKPDKTFKEVVREYGYPMFSKEVSNDVDGARRYISSKYGANYKYRIPITYKEKESTAMAMAEDLGKVKGSPQRLAKLLGMLTKENKIQYPNDDKSNYSLKKYQFLLESPFKVSDKCCNELKKKPLHNFEKKYKKVGITGQMASESNFRAQNWIRNGCNVYAGSTVKSNPMSFWTEQDVLEYIVKYNLPYCNAIYGDIAKNEKGTYETTGVKRTGCMFCMFGICFDEPPNRFEQMKQTHPQVYDYCMKPTNYGGLGMKDVIDWVNEHGDMDIRY